MRRRNVEWAARALALLGLAAVSTACFEHILDSTAPLGDREPIGRPAPFDARIAFMSTRDGVPYIYLAPEDGSAVHRLTRGERPAWSPDGNRIVFQARAGGTFDSVEVRVINRDGSGLRVLPKGGIHPSWSPDGERIVFATAVGTAAAGIYVMNADGAGLTMLLSSEFESPGAGDWLGFPAWSPDGKTIAFVRANYDASWQIYVVNADGSAPRRLSNGWGESEPSWSPDGAMIAFGRFQSVARMNADGSDYHVYATPATAFDPDWRPDGRGLVFNAFSSPLGDSKSSVGSRMRIYHLDPGTGAVRQLIPDAVAPQLPNYWDEQAVVMRIGGAGDWDY